MTGDGSLSRLVFREETFFVKMYVENSGAVNFILQTIFAFHRVIVESL